MKTIVVPLRHLLLDPNKRVDLETLPEGEAIRLIKESYGFLSFVVEVRLEGDLAVISLGADGAAKVQDALTLYEKGLKSARHADYGKAISLFQRVLDVVPMHVDARRNLAMAQLERGNPELAKNLLRECLRLDPSDVWSFVLLGNISARNDRNLEAAGFYYESGLAVNPGDNILLNNFAALRMQQDRILEAKALPGDSDHDRVTGTWIELPDAFRPRRGLFAAQVFGESMNRRTPNGAWCLFSVKSAGTRQGKVVLAAHREIADAELGGHYTVKVCESLKTPNPDGTWRHTSIRLKPDSTVPGYELIEINDEDAEDFKILAEVMAVLG